MFFLILINMKTLLMVLFISMLLVNTLHKKKSKKLHRVMNKYDTFYSWGVDHSVDFKSIELKYLLENDRFYVANEKIKKYDNILKIPFDVLITIDNPQVKAYCDIVFPGGYEDSEQECMSAFICSEFTKTDGYYYPYLNMFPTDYSFFPYYFTGERADLIKNTRLSDDAESLRLRLKSEYKDLKVNFSYDDYAKCRHVVFSRCFGIEIGKNKRAAMVPFADLFNFNPTKINTVWYFSNDDKSFHVDALEDIEIGAEIVDEYGENNNYHLLFSYGYTLENNIYPMTYGFYLKRDEVNLVNPIELIKVIPLFRIKKKTPFLI